MAMRKAKLVIAERQVKSHVSWRLHVLVFIVAFTILISRRPDALCNAQFWAEDGMWYGNAYNIGIINSLFLPSVGYFQTISRLTASVAQFFPLASAPLIFNLTAIVIKILPVNLIASSRFSLLIPSLSTRLFLALLYLALPNSFEVHANITNAQWYLAIAACMVVLATPSRCFLWCAFDIGVVLISALSGPFAVLLTPLAALLWWLRRQRWLFILLSCLSTGAVIQVVAILLTAYNNRPKTPLGATPELFAKIIAGQVFLGALIGEKGYAWVRSDSLGYTLLAILVASAGIAAFFYCLQNAPLELKLFSTFAALVFGVTLLSPNGCGTTPAWQCLSFPGIGGRYWLIPMLAFVIMLTWLLGAKKPLLLRRAAVVALLTMLVGVTLDWKYPAFADLDFRSYSSQFTAAPEGTTVKIPTNPPGWFMELTKHQGIRT